MTVEYRTITIAECPHCGESHTYRAKIERAVVLSMSEDAPETREYTVVRLFSCAKTGDDFQVTFMLPETSNRPIESVEISNADDTHE